ncbi:hypothetical protein ACN47E_010018 [Coniothyrium glycines]
MGDHDPPPFGYTFDDSFGGADEASRFGNAGQSLLSDHENRSLADFFQNGPFSEVPSSSTFLDADSKDTLFDYNNWGDFIAPATVHRVETTIPDQSNLHRNFPNEHAFAPPLPGNHFENTHDDLQAATTLFHNSQSYLNAHVQSFQPVPTPNRTVHPNGATQSTQANRLMVPTFHGPLNEHLAALLPNLGEEGTLDAQLAAQWASSNAQQRHDAEFGRFSRATDFKKSYTFGTDSSFNEPSGYSIPDGQHGESVSLHYSNNGQQESHRLLRAISGGEKPIVSLNDHMPFPLALTVDTSDAEQSEAPTTSEEEDRPAKKRRKSKNQRSKESPQKSARGGKGRRLSLIEEAGKKRRISAAQQRLQRENLTEEQKRSNHILSEQKRRNLIKRGFDDLHHLVPEIRNGGLSKSSVLLEAGNFLEKLIQENISFSQLAGGIMSS